MADPARQRMSFSDYLELQRSSPHKHEWLDGAAVAMSGGTRTHALLQVRAGFVLTGALGKGPCRVYSSDLMVRIPASGLATYPDLTVICGEFRSDAENPEAATNPVVLVEVLSPSTERWDRGDKFAHYQQLDSLRAYVLVNQDRQWIEWYARQDDGSWSYRCAGPGGVVQLDCLGVDLSVSELYEQTDVPIRDAPPLRLGEPASLPYGTPPSA